MGHSMCKYILDLEKAEPIKAKMEKNLRMARERVTELCKCIAVVGRG